MTTAAHHHRARIHRHRRAWQAMVALATAFAVLVAVVIATHSSGESARDAQFEGAVAACKRGNVVRAYLIADAAASARKPKERVERATQLFPILDCRATTREGAPVALPTAAQRAYIRATIPPLQ